MTIPWSTLNSVASAVDGLIIAYVLRRYFDRFILSERVAHGMVGAMLILTIAPIIANKGAPYLSRAGTPYTLWPSFFLRIAIATAYLSMAYRHGRHERANRSQIGLAREHFGRRL